MTRTRIDWRANWPKGELTFGRSGRARNGRINIVYPVWHSSRNNPKFYVVKICTSRFCSDAKILTLRYHITFFILNSVHIEICYTYLNFTNFSVSFVNLIVGTNEPSVQVAGLMWIQFKFKWFMWSAMSHAIISFWVGFNYQRQWHTNSFF